MWVLPYLDVDAVSEVLVYCGALLWVLLYLGVDAVCFVGAGAAVANLEHARLALAMDALLEVLLMAAAL